MNRYVIGEIESSYHYGLRGVTITLRSTGPQDLKELEALRGRPVVIVPAEEEER